jgi:hypothetical protein
VFPKSADVDNVNQLMACIGLDKRFNLELVRARVSGHHVKRGCDRFLIVSSCSDRFLIHCGAR